MDIEKFKKAMRPKKYLDGNFVVYDKNLPEDNHQINSNPDIYQNLVRYTDVDTEDLTVKYDAATGLFSNKDKLKKAGISIGSFLAVIILAFILSEGVETPMQDGKVLSAAGSRWVETGIRTFYLLTLIAVGIMIFNSVRKLIKK